MNTNTKRLARSTTDRTIAGVCAGIAHYFGIDPVLVRVLFVISALAGGPGLILYIVLWIVMPEDTDVAKEKSKRVQVPDYEYENSRQY
jgi:phage shock protein C